MDEQLASLSHNAVSRKNPGLSFSVLQFSKELEWLITEILPVLSRMADVVVTVPHAPFCSK